MKRIIIAIAIVIATMTAYAQKSDFIIDRTVYTGKLKTLDNKEIKNVTFSWKYNSNTGIEYYTLYDFKCEPGIYRIEFYMCHEPSITKIEVIDATDYAKNHYLVVRDLIKETENVKKWVFILEDSINEAFINNADNWEK